jgi:hypothetical protein
MTPAHLLAILIGVGSVGAWFGLYGLAMLITRPARPAPAPATQDLPGDEPPAVVSLLTNHWEVTEDAAESTLIDLAARRLLEFRQPGNDPAQTTVHVREPHPTGLTSYEQRIFDRVAGLAVGGVIPLTALTFRDQGRAAAFEKRLRAEIIADARSRGLSRRRFNPAILTVLTLGAVAAGLGVAAAVFLLQTRSTGSDNSPIKGAGYAWFFSAVILAGIGHRPVGERDTPAGREVCSRWLGVRGWLQRTEAFADLPPAAVAVWDRYLSYGDAVGATRICAAVIDLGMGNRKRVWSSYGGNWHRVRVRYPGVWLRYGKPARKLIVRGVLAGGIGFVLLYYWAKGIANALRNPTIGGSPAAHFADPVRTVGLLLGGVLLVYGLYFLVRTVIDLAAPATITGQVLWLQVWKSTTGSENSPSRPWLHYLAVDDGTDDRTSAWALPTEMSGRAHDGDTVTIQVRRWSRRVVELTVVSQGAMRTVDAVAVTDEKTENIIAAAMGLPGSGGIAGGALAQALRGPKAVASELLSAEEVGRALGAPVTGRPVGAGSPMPIQMMQFLTPDGRPAVQLMASAGLAGQLAIRARRRGRPLPGIGDEAYTGDGWAAGRRGDTVIMLILSEAGRRADPRNIWWLLSTAIGRLPAPVG